MLLTKTATEPFDRSVNNNEVSNNYVIYRFAALPDANIFIK